MSMLGQLTAFPYMGGKHYLVQDILAQFPQSEDYDLYLEACGGAAHILLNRPRGHIEVYNDLDQNLVNWWRQCQTYGKEMMEQLAHLPYARILHRDYHQSLFDGTPLTDFERAVRWYYVLCSSFRNSVEKTDSGWKGGLQDARHHHASSYQARVQSLPAVAERIREVEIEHRDCCDLIEQYSRYQEKYGTRALIYVDPGYIGKEDYYPVWQYLLKQGETSQGFHERLAKVLNASPCMVALSYYDHTWLDDLYPPEEGKWRRVSFDAVKHSQRTKGGQIASTKEKAAEVLLMNYPERAPSLWEGDVSYAHVPPPTTTTAGYYLTPWADWWQTG